MTREQIRDAYEANRRAATEQPLRQHPDYELWCYDETAWFWQVPDRPPGASS